jgi:hypothetical protein
VTSADQSPMNARRWCCELSCGHEVWVTASRKPKRVLCLTCATKKPAGEKELTLYLQRRADEGHCMANRDGDCDWSGCPQIRDGEPRKTGRHCPRDAGEKETERG